MRLPPLLLLLAVAVIGAPAWAQAPAALPLVVDGGRVELLVLDAASLTDQLANARANLLLRRCVSVLRPPPANLAEAQRDSALPNFRAWDFGPRIATNPDRVLLLLLPVEAGRMDCADEAAQHSIVAARGIRIARDTTVAGSDALVSASLQLGGTKRVDVVPLPGVMRFVTARGNFDLRSTAWIAELDLSDLAPDTQGRATELVVQYVMEGTGARSFSVPGSVVDALWLRAVERRVAQRIPREASAPGPRLVAPPPLPSSLRAAYDGYRQGALGPYAAAAAAALTRENLSVEDRRSTLVTLGGAFAQAGDREMATQLFRSAYAADPCLRLNGALPDAVRQVTAPLAAPVRECEPRGLARFALTGGLIPGLARPRRGSYVARAAIALAGTAALAYVATTALGEAEDSYASYLATQFNTAPTGASAQASALYARAEDRRRAGVSLARAAIALYGAAVLDGYLVERKYNRYLRRLVEYGDVIP